MRATSASLLLLLGTSSISAAGEPNTTAEAGDHRADEKHWRRELNGHFFVPSLTVPDPFVPTLFSLSTGAGHAWVDGPSFDPRGNPVGGESYRAAALAESMTFQAAILSWWALRLASGGGLYGGVNARSALVLGAIIPLDVTPGTTVSWKIGRFVRLGGTFDFQYQYRTVIDPLAAVRTSLASSQVDTSQVHQRVNSYSVIPGATVAAALHPAVGLVGSVQYLWNGRDDGTSTQSVSYIVIGVSAQLDLKPLVSRVPLGVLGAYRAQIPFESSERLIQSVEGALFYTGRKDLALGLDLQGQWFDLRPGSPFPLSASALIAALTVRYYWN
jgi:hypothetical protein